MEKSDEFAEKTSEFLLQIKAVTLNVAKPYTWTSGIISPIYCDNRVTLSYHKIRTYLRQAFTRVFNEEFGAADVIAGVATGAIAHGVLVAEELGLPFVYIRPAKKGHGLANVIEGRVESGQSVVVIEDLISTGKSSLHAVKALREAGCVVKGMIAIFTYGLEKAKRNFEKENCILYTLTDYNILIEKALEENYITDKEVDALKEWRENPEKWGK
jgi:orotate phosphoribosyltransferase